MPAEVPVPRAGDQALGLIETFRWSRDGGYDLLGQHMSRLATSAAACGFVLRSGTAEARLARAAEAFDGPCQRVRLVLDRDGGIAVTAAPLPLAPPEHYRVAVAGPRNRADDPTLRHKLTTRDRYEGPLAEASARLGVDEVLFLNERDELCEGARTNLFVSRDAGLVTPPLRCGLLPGTLRAHLLETGRAREAVLHLADLAPGTAWFMGNSVRGLVPATLVGAG